MKVSIITVCRNAQDTIEDSIKSVINQNYSDIEHIFIDGLSTDNTNSIIQKYSDSEKIKHISQSDTGIYNAMNKGVKLARGDILFFLNANDYLYDDSVITDVVNEFKRSRADIIWGKIANLHEDNSIQLSSKEIIDKLYFLNGNNMCHQSIFYKSSLLKKHGGYDETLKIAADFDFNLKVLLDKNNKYVEIDRTIAKFSIGGFSTSDKYRNLLLTERDIVINRQFSQWEIKLNKVLSKSFRSIIKNPTGRRFLCLLLGLNINR